MTAVLTRRSPPGPRGKPLVGNLFEVARDPIGCMERWAREQGDLVEFKLGPYRLWLVNEPELVRHVLEKNAGNYPKSVNYRDLELVLGKGLLTSEGSFWLRNRKLVQPAFHPRRDAGSLAAMSEAIRALLADWDREGEATFDIAPDMGRLALGAVGRALFGIDLARDATTVADALKVLTRYVEARWVSIVKWPWSVPTPSNVRAWRAARVVDSRVQDVIRERRANPEARDDLLSALVRARDEGSLEGMDERQLRDEVVTLMLAGHETTACALTWAWWLLAKNPEVARKLEAEVDAALGKREPALADLEALRWPSLIAQEALRLYPPAWWFERQAAGPDELGGFPVEPETLMVICPYTLHRHPRFWDRPLDFDPERFTPERSQGRPRHAFIPFGAGPRLCVGSRFALLEMQLAFVLLAQRWSFDLVPDHPVVPESLVTLKPRNGVRLVRRRRP